MGLVDDDLRRPPEPARGVDAAHGRGEVEEGGAHHDQRQVGDGDGVSHVLLGPARSVDDQQLVAGAPRRLLQGEQLRPAGLDKLGSGQHAALQDLARRSLRIGVGQQTPDAAKVAGDSQMYGKRGLPGAALARNHGNRLHSACPDAHHELWPPNSSRGAGGRFSAASLWSTTKIGRLSRN
jgi:hypothetical protein